MNDSPRWRRRKQSRPQEILEAALASFAEKGFAATRMDEIAERAGVTKGTIYLYFENKEAVFKALVRESIGAQVDQIVESVGKFEGSACELLNFFLRTMGSFAAHSDRVVLAKVLIAEAGNFPELAQFYREEIIDKGIAALTAIIKRGIANGEFRNVAAEHVVRLCIAPVLLGIIWRTTFAQFDKEQYDIEGLIETHLGVLLNGLATAKGDA